MNRILLLLLACGIYASAYSQTEPLEPCCSIIAMDVKNNLAVARDNTTGRLYQFKADALDMKAINKGDAVTIDPASKKITAISGAVRSYPVIQPDKAQPLGILITLRIDNAEPISGITPPRTNGATPISDIKTPKINYGEPCCNIVSIQPDPAQPLGNNVVSFKNNSTGTLSSFRAPKNISSGLKVGQPVYAGPINGMKINNAEPIKDFAIVQSSYGSNGQMNSYGYPATSGDGATGNTNEGGKWVITPVSTMKGVLGKLDINFPADVERDILIYQPADNKFITSVSRNDKTYSIAPGEYRFTITAVPVENVPIQKGHETRIKMGFLNVVSEGDWHLYNDTKEKQYTSGNKPKRIALPVGSYQLKLGTQFYPVVLKDAETVEL